MSGGAPTGPGSVRREPGEVFGPRMSLFADVLSVGLVTAVVCLPLVTVPAAFSTACAVLRGARTGEPTTAGRYLRLLGQRLRWGDVAAGAVALAGVLLLLADLAVARAGLPGGWVVAWTIAGIGVCALVVGMRCCARPESVTDWRAALDEAARDARRDPGGSALLLLATASAVASAWMMLPLVFLVAGPLALALTAVDLRARAAG